MKVKIVVLLVLLALQTVNSFTFPSPTLFPITELTQSTEAPQNRESREAILSSLHQIRLTLLKNLQVIGTPITSFLLYNYLLTFPHFGIPGDIESKVKTRQVYNGRLPRFPKQTNYDAIYYIRMRRK